MSNIPTKKKPPCDQQHHILSSNHQRISTTTSSSADKQHTSRPGSRGALLSLPHDLQVNWLTYLRAYDLVSVQQTCMYYARPALVHAVVLHTSEHVYPSDLTQGFDQEPLMNPPSSNRGHNSKSTPNGRQLSSSNSSGANSNRAAGKPSSSSLGLAPVVEDQHGSIMTLYTYENLRNMELLVVARVLSRPEPSTGYIVSKSWCKTALKWLEVQQEQRLQQQQQQQNATSSGRKKISKKKQRMRDRRLSDVSPPWPNVNSDLLCEHNSLSTCSNSKSANARRRLLDKQAWRLLKKLYPDSTQLDSTSGECIQCLVDAETLRMGALQKASQAKLQRKQPLGDPIIRRFYTRTRGVPEHCLVGSGADDGGGKMDKSNIKKCGEEDSKLPATFCPLKPGVYHVLPRVWCHGWRKYIKTGENVFSTADTASGAPSLSSNGISSSSTTVTAVSSSFPPPDSATLLCDAHRIALIPPHLDVYLSGKSSQLLGGGAGADATTDNSRPGVVNDLNTIQRPTLTADTAPASSVTAFPSSSKKPPPLSSSSSSSSLTWVPGQGPDASSQAALQAAGMTMHDVALQLSAMRDHEQSRSMSSIGNNNNNTFNSPGVAGNGGLIPPPSSVSSAAASTPANLTSSTPQMMTSMTTCGVVVSRNELLDRENFAVVEIITDEEFVALEKLWPGTSVFSLRFAVGASPGNAIATLLQQQQQQHTTASNSLSSGGGVATTTTGGVVGGVVGDVVGCVAYSTTICRDCDATGRQCSVSIKNRARGWVKRSSEKARAPASLEY